jgi:nucleoside-diphosphate-sugar epimerase
VANALSACLHSRSLKEQFGGEIPKIDLYQADLTDRSSIDRIFEAYESKGKIWGVIHLAVGSGTPPWGRRGHAGADLDYDLQAWKAVGESNELPLQYYENNVSGTLNLLHASRNHLLGRPRKPNHELNRPARHPSHTVDEGPRLSELCLLVLGHRLWRA